MTNLKTKKTNLKKTKNVIHYSVWSVCVSFVSACTLDWCYNSDLWQADRTYKEEEVTCKKCLKQLKEWEEMDFTEAEIHFTAEEERHTLEVQI